MIEYEPYILADRLFYDTLERRRDESPDFALAARPVPGGWEHVRDEAWAYYAPEEGDLPPQGWKIHVSALAEDAERVLETVWDYCVPRGIAFKFLRSPAVLMMRNSKAAPREASAKLVTIYPRDVGQLETVLAELDAALEGVPGPYVLSDLRYGAGPLYVRYGGFVERRCRSESGELVSAIEDPEGRLVPDLRGPTFALPPWVSLPPFLEPHLAARNAVTVEGIPYAIESVLHFSNGGGVYRGRDRRIGELVVLKEGRPHAGLDVAGRDAVARIAHERDMLERLAGLGVAPAVRDHFVLGEHHFLVQELVDGVALQQALVDRYPLAHPDPSPAELSAYVEWALEMAGRAERAVAALHGRGVVFGDLHPDNILLTADGRTVLIDFEVATLAEDRARSALAHPGYSAPPDRRGVEADRYALACLRLGLFGPQTTIMLPLTRAKAAHLAEIARETFGLPPDALAGAVETILGEADEAELEAMRALPLPGTASWGRLRDAMARAILASATPERDDRLFPGDIDQFTPGGGLNLATGAAGVLYALAATDAGVEPAHEEWLRARALHPPPGMGPGLYDGLLGVAVVMEELGRRQDALDVAELCRREPWEAYDLSLHSGLAGVGLSLLRLGERTGEPELREAALRLVDMTADRLGGPDDVPEISGGSSPRAGLMYGSSGPALLLLHAYERTGDPALLERAEVALRQDLRRCVEAEDGTLQVNQGWRTLPYLDEGSAGIGLALDRYLAHRDDEALASALNRMRMTARARYFVQPGLFTGRAGLIAWLGMSLQAAGASAAEGIDPEAAELIRGLAWHALPHAGGLAFPGDQLLRLSMDLATGTAGVLLAVGTVMHDRPVSLPLCEPPTRAGVPSRASPRRSGERLETHG